MTVGMKLTALPSARTADRVVAISEWARGDLVATLGLPPERVDVTPLGARLPVRRGPATPGAELRGRLGLGGGPVVLSVGQKREHKNQLALIRALPRLADRGVRLVLPGAVTPYEATLRAEADALGVADRVVFPPWLAAADLEGLYALATCFALPSFEEGFGLPILEAMARGVPVACSDASCLPEVAGGAALLFDPHDPADVATALDRLLGDTALREDLRARGRRRAGEFPWSATAEATLETYARAIR